MNEDAVAQLIQRVQNQLPQDAASALMANSDFLTSVDNLVGLAASYAQILSTVAGPIAQVASASTIANITSTAATLNALDQASSSASAAEQALAALEQGADAGNAALSSALASAAVAGEAAAIVVVVALVLAVLTEANQSGSSESQALQQLATEVQNIQDITLATYWQDKLTSIMASWNSPTGGLGDDLDNLANERLTGINVVNDVSGFHDNAQAFVNNLIPAKTPGADVYWERPFVAGQIFSAAQVPYPEPVLAGTPPDAPIAIGSIMGWYGTLPQPQIGPPLGGSGQQMVTDPRTAMPFLLLGLNSYLTIEMLVNFIDPVHQPTFGTFLAQFNGDLQTYAQFLGQQYALAVNGIVKTDIPSNQDMASYLYFMAEVVGGASFPDNTQWWQGSLPYPDASGWPYLGYAWNGVYGAADSNPPYGVYEPTPQSPIPGSAPAYLIDLIDTSSLVAELTQAWPYLYLQNAMRDDWVLPWLTNKLILGAMARWKAVYLLNGYDKVLSILQNLYQLSQLGPLPTQILNLAQDGMIADGNWSARELCAVVNTGGYILSGVQYGTLSGGFPDGDYSMFALAQCLDNIASGNWAGPPSYSAGPGSPGPARPIGLRDRLAAAAV
jgi:hypothetical protein